MFSFQYDDISPLAVCFLEHKITCEKLTILFPQEEETIPPELINILKPLKFVIRPSLFDRATIKWRHEHFVAEVVSSNFPRF